MRCTASGWARRTTAAIPATGLRSTTGRYRMTLGDFYAELPGALDRVGAELLRSEGVYPHGPRLRFKVRPPAHWFAGPSVLDPIGVVWYARTGEWRGLLAGLRTATTLGLPPEDALTLLQAADEVLGPSTGPVGRAREGLIAVVEGWRSLAPARTIGP